MSVNITFLGGADTVTGSKFLVRHDGHSLLVDCGLFQGYKQLRLRNWRPLPVVPGQIHAVILTHAHLDHSGYLPVLAREGFHGRVHATPARATCAPSCCPTAATSRKKMPPSPTGTASRSTHRPCRCTRAATRWTA
jgi:Cft2 family RNA processing exonuclease